MIRFILNGAIWVLAILLLLPALVATDTVDGNERAYTESDHTTSMHAVRIATGLAADLGALCQRNPQTCDSARVIAMATMDRAQHGWAIASDLMAKPADGQAPQSSDSSDD